MATVINPLGEEYQADCVLVQRIVTARIKVYVPLDDWDSEPWTEDEDIAEEVNDAISVALAAANRAIEEALDIEILSVDNETMEVID